MTEFARALLRDLAAASEHLLDEGLAPRATSTQRDSGVRGPAGHTLHLNETFRRTALRALQELERLPVAERESVVTLRVPRRAAPSRRPYDYVEHAGTLAPVVWESRRPELELPADHLAWIEHGTDLLLERLAWHRSVVDEAWAEAVTFREGTRFGREELDELDHRRQALEDAERATRSLRSHLVRQSPTRLRATARLPYPFPNTAAWRTLRVIQRALEDPSAALPALVADMQDPDSVGVDLAYLYQRWCGWKLVEALVEFGFQPTTDPVPPLLLAGSIEFRREAQTLTLLCEPRLASRKQALHGIFVTHGESSPDLVLVGETHEELSVYVLDPTLRMTPEARREKQKYLEALSVRRSRTVAGVRLSWTGPDRAWAAAPTDGTMCEPADWRGMHGTVPMNPLGFEGSAISEWLRDLVVRLR